MSAIYKTWPQPGNTQQEAKAHELPRGFEVIGQEKALSYRGVAGLLPDSLPWLPPSGILGVRCGVKYLVPVTRSS